MIVVILIGFEWFWFSWATELFFMWGIYWFLRAYREDFLRNVITVDRKFGVGQMVTRHSFRMPEGKDGLKELLQATGCYHFEGDMVFVKESYTRKFNHARMVAIDHYADALARFGIIKENEGANGMIVTGPLAMAIDGVYKQLGYKGLAEVIDNKIIENYNTRELDKIKQYYGFEVICDDRFKLEDNTECKDLIVNSEFAGNNRYNWDEVDFNK